MTIHPSQFIVILLALCLPSCKNKSKTFSTSASQTSPPTESPSFQQKKVEQKIGNCSDDQSCLEVVVNYPVLQGVPQNIQQAINQDIVEQIVESMEMEEPSDSISIEQAAGLWAESYKEYLSDEEQERVILTYQLEGKGSLFKHYAIAELPLSTYTGGAHPNYLTYYLNYNLNDGQSIEMEDIIQDSTAFHQLVERAFFKAVKEKGAEEDKDIYFWGKPFYLPANFAIRESGLQFIYNPYEVAPYAFGITEFTIPYKELGTLIKLP